MRHFNGLLFKLFADFFLTFIAFFADCLMNVFLIPLCGLWSKMNQIALIVSQWTMAELVRRLGGKAVGRIRSHPQTISYFFSYTCNSNCKLYYTRIEMLNA
jgi:hypothetical protein